MTKIQIILGSTRPTRNGEQVAKWVYEQAKERSDAEFELVDIADYELPLFDEPISPAYGPHSKEHSKKWAKKIAEADGYIFVTAEYNHSIPGALKNAIDFVYHEWNNKAAGFVGYGALGGVRAVEHLRQVMGEIRIADVRASLYLQLGSDFENMSILKTTEQHEKLLGTVIDQTIEWAEALKPLRK